MACNDSCRQLENRKQLLTVMLIHIFPLTTIQVYSCPEWWLYHVISCLFILMLAILSLIPSPTWPVGGNTMLVMTPSHGTASQHQIWYSLYHCHKGVKALSTWLFAQQLLEAKIQVNIKTLHYWTFVSGFPSKGQLCRNHIHVMILHWGINAKQTLTPMLKKWSCISFAWT